MTDTKKEGREPASIFWEERACQFDDLSPAIAAICRDKANSAWLAAECDRLTAALAQAATDKVDAMAKLALAAEDTAGLEELVRDIRTMLEHAFELVDNDDHCEMCGRIRQYLADTGTKP